MHIDQCGGSLLSKTELLDKILDEVFLTALMEGSPVLLAKTF